MNKNRKMTKKNVMAVTGAALAACLMIGGSFAYLTDGESNTNTITVGEVQIDLVEPAWDALADEEKQLVVSSQELAMDPSVKNTGENDAIVFSTISTPVRSVAVTNSVGTPTYGFEDDGITLKRQETNLVGFKLDDVSATVYDTAFDDGWLDMSDTYGYYIDSNGELVEKTAVTEALATDPDCAEYSYVHVLGHKTAIAPGAATSNMFDKIQLANVVEDQVAVNVDEDVIVSAYAIQADNIYEVVDSADVDLTDDLSDANLGKIYEVFLNQNKKSGDTSTSATTVRFNAVDADTNNEFDLSGTAIN